MFSEFTNQLSRKEIIQGTFIYTNKKLWLPLLMFGLIFFTFSYLNTKNIFFSLLSSLVLFLILEFLLILVGMRQFSPHKIARFKLYDNHLEVTNHAGATYSFQYTQIGSYSNKNIIVLFLSKSSFTIISKKCISEEQCHILQKK